MNAVRNLLSKHPRAEWLIPAALCLILLAQTLCSVRQMSQHADESTHLYAGYRALKCSDYAFGREHPPLAKMLSAIPLVWSNPPLDCAQSATGVEEADQAIGWLYSQPDWWHLLSEARVASSLFSAALCLGVWIAARRMFGRLEAVVATAALAFEPNILSQGALVLNNVLLSALFLFTVFSFYLWTRRRSPLFLVLTGFFAGLALLTKHSAALLIPILCLLAVIEAWQEKSDKTGPARRALRNLVAVAALLVIACVTIWCGYGMHYNGGTRRASNSIPQEQLAGLNSADVRILKGMRAAHLMPQPYLDGLIEARGLVTGEMVTAPILGRLYSEAPLYFLPLTTAIKFTLPFLAMLVLGGAGIVASGRERRTEIVFLLLPALLYLAVCMNVRRITGIWQLFPMIPFLLIAAAAGCTDLARRYRWAAGVLVLLLVFHAASSLRAYPNYISYANEAWGGPENLYKYLPGADLGQAYWQVSRYMEQHPGTPCWVDSNYFVPAAKYVPCKPMGAMTGSNLTEHMRGIVFVSSSWLQVEGQPGGPLAPFYASEPKARLGGSAMFVYEGEYDTSVAAARALCNLTGVLLESGDRANALLLARHAVELAPSYERSHYWYGITLVTNGYVQDGLFECSTARKLAMTDPLNQPDARNMTRYIQYISQEIGSPVPPEMQ
jgi:4-amino-4-deoxy-L-arabinose transferase-like glycosyltransferase